MYRFDQKLIGVSRGKVNNHTMIIPMILKKAPFEVMRTGEKTAEYRDNSDYWRRRLFNKDGTVKNFKYVEFSNGYQKNRPQFMVEFLSVEVIDEVHEGYSTGFKVDYPYKKEGYLKINLGKVIPSHPPTNGEKDIEEPLSGRELRNHLKQNVFTDELVGKLQDIVDITTIIDPKKLK